MLFKNLFVFTCSLLQNGSQSLPKVHTCPHVIQRLKTITPEYTERFPRDQIVIGTTSEACLFWICLTQRLLPAPINERQGIDHYTPSCLISVQIFIITSEGCLFRTVHTIVWMSHWGGKGLATEGTRTKWMGAMFNPVCCTPHTVACVRKHILVRACVCHFFVCVCVSDFFLNSSTILENRWILRCGTSERPCPKPQTQWGRTLQTSPQCENTHIRSFSFPAFKPRSSSKARVSDTSVKADLNYESLYLVFALFYLLLLSHWELLIITLTPCRMLSQDHKQSGRCRKYCMVTNRGLADIQTPDWPLHY